ncbi:MAG: DNA mismatch repair protein MutT, partial [Candidatus Saccharimonadales bacterium]
DWNQQVVVFSCNEWEGEPIETEEMSPRWFAIKEIPYAEMWADDKYWLPEVLNGRYIKADFYFDENDNLLSYKVLP